jgi:hypothetical protein
MDADTFGLPGWNGCPIRVSHFSMRFHNRAVRKVPHLSLRLYPGAGGDVVAALVPKHLSASVGGAHAALCGCRCLTWTAPKRLAATAATNACAQIWHFGNMLARRLDLFYRLKVFPIEVPPLRERKEDLLILARHDS